MNKCPDYTMSQMHYSERSKTGYMIAGNDICDDEDCPNW
jgi:hypothetical protein